MKISKSHPRAVSLQIREKLVKGLKNGITSQAGLLAHGRGEAFDYLIGEKTHLFAHKAIEAAAQLLVQAHHPILSINGNTAALVVDEFITLAHLLHCNIEVNLFHHSQKRVNSIEKVIKEKAPGVLIPSTNKKKRFRAIASARNLMLKEGIGKADVVLVPLEDGDRCEALLTKGKKVVTVDLNPLSRTAQKATITIVDNITRVMPLLIAAVRKQQKEKEEKNNMLFTSYDNKKTLADALLCISTRLNTLATVV